MKIRTGIFGGSFNPIHIGHLAIANYLCEYEELDELWFMVTPQNPLKQHEDLMPDDLRLSMVRASIQEYPKFGASDFEFNLPRPSYTINTLNSLKETYPERSFYIIIGGDNWLAFPKWRDGDRLIAENNIIVYPRPGYPVDETSLPPTVRLTNAPLLDISSSFIRRELRKGKDLRYFVHPEVYRILHSQNLLT